MFDPAERGGSLQGIATIPESFWELSSYDEVTARRLWQVSAALVA